MLRLQPLPTPPIYPLSTSTSLFFITCIFPSPILPVLSAVSKIDWGLLCILVHVGMVARVRSLSICLGCQGVSRVPACLLLNIYHLFNAVPPPPPQSIGLLLLLLIPPTLLLSFSFFLHTFLSLWLLFHVFSCFSVVFSMWYYLIHSVCVTLCLHLSPLPYLNFISHVYLNTCPCLLLPFCFSKPWSSRLKLRHHGYLPSVT